MTFTRTNFEESIIIKMFTIPLLYCENIITTEKYKPQFKPRKNSTRVSLVYTLLFSYNCMIAKVLSEIYHAMSKTNQIFSSSKSHAQTKHNNNKPTFFFNKIYILRLYIFFQKYIEFEIICNSPVNR